MVLAQDSGGSLLPDWLADAPPWLQAIGLVVFGIPTVLAAVLPLVLLVQKLRKGVSTKNEDGDSTEGPEASTKRTSAPVPPEERYDAKMAVIERLIAGVEKDQEHDRAEMEKLGARIQQLESDLRAREADVRARDATIAELRRTIDQLLGRPPQGPTTPPWTQARPDRSSGN